MLKSPKRWEPRRFIRHSSGKTKIPVIMQRQVSRIQKVQENHAFDLKMNKAGAQLNCVESSADTGSSTVQCRAKHFERRECRQRKDSRKAVASGSQRNGARRA